VTLNLQINGENTGNPAAFSISNQPGDTRRLLTNSPVLWDITDHWELGWRRITSDLSPVIESIVHGSWQPGGTLSIIVKNLTTSVDPTPVRRVIGFERATSYPPAGYSPAKLIAAYDLPTTLLTYTYYSFAAQDGWILESKENSNVGGSVDAAATTFRIGDDSSNKQYRGILHFDTSGLPDTAQILYATLRIKQQSIWGTNPFTTHGNLIADIKKPYFGSNANLAKSDFEAMPGLSGIATFNPTPDNGWYSASISSAGFPYINLTDTTQFRLAFALDDNNDRDPDYIAFSSGNDIVANRPQLIIYYYIP
jgi:hypothetical protein